MASVVVQVGLDIPSANRALPAHQLMTIITNVYEKKRLGMRKINSLGKREPYIDQSLTMPEMGRGQARWAQAVESKFDANVSVENTYSYIDMISYVECISSFSNVSLMLSRVFS